MPSRPSYPEFTPLSATFDRPLQLEVAAQPKPDSQTARLWRRLVEQKGVTVGLVILGMMVWAAVLVVCL